MHLGASPARDAPEPENCNEPQAFCVRRPSSQGRLRVHWHPVPQFQYFVGGAGRMVNHEVQRGCVHYADAYTPYGPLDVVADDVAFLTLRATTDHGAFFMPETQTELRTARIDRGHPTPRRNLSFDLAHAAAGVVVADDDGLAIEVLDISPTQSARVDPGDAGAYVVVVGGTLVDALDVVEVNGFRFVAHAESLRAGADGARVGVLRFPRAATPT